MNPYEHEHFYNYIHGALFVVVSLVVIIPHWWKKMKAPDEALRRVFITLFGALFLLIGVFSIVSTATGMKPAERRARDLAILDVDPDHVVSITLGDLGLPGDTQPLFRSNVTLTARADITNICAALSSASRMVVNHPSSIWTCGMALTLAANSHRVQMSNTSNQGLILWLYQESRCDQLAPLLENIAEREKSHAASNNRIDRYK